MIFKRVCRWLILLVGLCLPGQPAFADTPAKQPSTLAEIISFTVQGGQVVPELLWRPPGQQATIKLQDIPGDTSVIVAADPQGNAAANYSVNLNSVQKNGNTINSYALMVLPGIIFITSNQQVENAGGPGVINTSILQLQLSQHRFSLHYETSAPGQEPTRHNVDAPSWSAFLKRHPEDVDKRVRPLLEMLHLESLLGGTADLWAYQVLADRLSPSPELNAQVKQLIDQLDDVFAEKRDEASDKLKKLGNPALAVLVRLDRSGLSPEQADCVGQIAKGAFLDDQQVKAFKTDKKFLLDCMQSRDEAIRVAAAAQLAVVIGQAIDFDPAGPIPTRSAQLEKLRQQMLVTTQPAKP